MIIVIDSLFARQPVELVEKLETLNVHLKS